MYLTFLCVSFSFLFLFLWSIVDWFVFRKGIAFCVGSGLPVMDCKELNLNEDCGGCGSGGKNGGDGFIDRSKVRILLCDNDSKSSEEVFKLLLKCSYQGTSFPSFLFSSLFFSPFNRIVRIQSTAS